MSMTDKFLISVLLLFVLFTTNLSNRILTKNIKTITTSEQATSECDPEKNYIPSPLNLLLIISAVTSHSSSLTSSEHSFNEKNVNNPTLNLLFLANAPPALS